MSSYEYFSSSSESETDEEFYERLHETEEAQRYDEASHRLCDLMRIHDIHSPLNGPMDGSMLKQCLRADITLDDVVVTNRLKYSGKSALGGVITDQRMAEFRTVARAMAQHYAPANARFMSYINDLTASLIRYHYRL